MSGYQASAQAMKDITSSVIATTLVLMAIFIPGGLMAGMTGKIYVPAECQSTGDYYHAAVEIAGQLLKEKELPEVLYCVSDEITLVLMDIFRRNGLNFPGDIRIISGGDSDFLNGLSDPPPVLRQNIPKLAEIAVKHLTGRINDGKNTIGENLCAAEINQRLLFPDGSTQFLAEDKINTGYY